MSEEIRIDLKSSADTKGFDQMGAAAKGATAGLDAAGRSSKEMAANLGRGVEVGNSAVSAMSNLGNATKGGADGMMALARAGFGVGASLKGIIASVGPLGMIAASIGVAFGVVSLALKKSEDAAEEAKKKLEELNKLKLEGAKQELKAIGNAATEATRAIDQQYTSLNRIADAQLALDIANVKASKLSPEAEGNAIKRLQRQRERGKMDAEQQKLDAIAETLGISAADAEQVRLKRAAELAVGENKLARVAAAEAAMKTVQRSSTTGSYGMSLGESPEQSRLSAELDAAKKAAEGISLETLKTSLKDATEAARDAQKKAEEAAAAASSERGTQGALRPLIDQTYRADDAANRPRTDAEISADSGIISRYRSLGSAVIRNRIASGDANFNQRLLGEAFPKEFGEGSSGAKALQSAAEAMKNAPTGDAAAKAAEEAAKATQEHVKQRAAADAATSAAISQTTAATVQLAQLAGQQAQQMNQITAQLGRVQSQLATMRANTA